jgi:hypothetical protein
MLNSYRNSLVEETTQKNPQHISDISLSQCVDSSNKKHDWRGCYLRLWTVLPLNQCFPLILRWKNCKDAIPFEWARGAWIRELKTPAAMTTTRTRFDGLLISSYIPNPTSKNIHACKINILLSMICKVLDPQVIYLSIYTRIHSLNYCYDRIPYHIAVLSN